MNDMGGRRQIEPGAPRFHGQHEEGDVFVILESANQILARLDLGLAVQNETRPTEHGAQESRQRRCHLLELGEDQHLLLPCRDFFRDFPQARELAAVRLGPCVVAQPLRGMIANLFQPHQQRKHDAATLDSIRLFELTGKIVDCLLIQRHLLSAQQTEGLHFGLVRQVRDDALVGLHATQDIGTHKLAQRSVRIVRPVSELLDESGKLLGRSQ